MLSSDVDAVSSVGAKLGCAASMGLCAGCQISGWAHSHLIGSTQRIFCQHRDERIQKTSDRMSEAGVLDWLRCHCAQTAQCSPDAAGHWQLCHVQRWAARPQQLLARQQTAGLKSFAAAASACGSAGQAAGARSHLRSSAAVSRAQGVSEPSPIKESCCSAAWPTLRAHRANRLH